MYGDYTKEDPMYKFTNGALLCSCQHAILNLIENYDLKFVAGLNDGFKEFKMFRNYIIIMQMKEATDKWLEDQGYEIVELEKCFVPRRKI